MSALIEATGTFTALAQPLPAATEPNTPDANNLVIGTEGDFTPPIDELSQFIVLVAVAYGTGFWPAAAFLKHQLTALFQDAPRKLAV